MPKPRPQYISLVKTYNPTNRECHPLSLGRADIQSKEWQQAGLRTVLFRTVRQIRSAFCWQQTVATLTRGGGLIYGDTTKKLIDTDPHNAKEALHIGSGGLIPIFHSFLFWTGSHFYHIFLYLNM